MLSDTTLSLFSFFDLCSRVSPSPPTRAAKAAKSTVLATLTNLGFLICLTTYYCYCHLDVFSSSSEARKKELVTLNTSWL